MRKTILFLDDDPKRMSSYVDFLEQNGYDTTLESDSSEAIKTVRERRNEIDLIVIDMMMPTEQRLKHETDYGRRTGLYLLKEIRKISDDIPIIVLTVVRDSSLRKETEILGASPYLEKPIMPSRLEEEIKKKLEGRKRQ